MITYSRIRAGLLSTALLLTTSIASPSFANSSHILPELSPRQIAGDVKISYNPQTGSREYVAPSFDPFEDDRNLAGTAQLRSANNAIAIDGRPLRGGALLDLSFYYNSSSSDPYDNRGYADGVFLSGDYAGVTHREASVLECSENIQDVVYYHEDYYGPSAYLGLFRPYRHYRGFNRFGAHGYGGYSPYSYSGGHYGGYARGYSPRNYRRGRSFGGGSYRGRHESDRRRDRNGRAENRRDESRQRDDNRAENNETRRTETRRRVTEAERGAARGRMDRNRRNENARNLGMSPRVGSRMNRRLENEPRRPQGSSAPSASPAPAARPAQRAAAPRQAAPVREAAPRQATPRRETSRPAKRPRSERAFQDRLQKEDKAFRKKSNLRGARIMALGPMASLFGRSNRRLSTQCAREEKLSLHIPQERLDAARFDGMTILVLDRAGDELPVFIPPNYIEGFRQASANTVISSGHISSIPAPSVTTSPYLPDIARETAPCPTGTTLQSDGTCLTSGYSGYPTR